MWRYALHRVVYMLFTLLGLSLAIFVLMRLVPGTIVSQMVDPQAAGSPQQLEQLRHFFGLDQPWYRQYLHWLGGVLIGRLGDSWRIGGPVAQLVFSHLNVTLELAVLAVAFSALAGVPLGVWAAVRHTGVADVVIRLLSLGGLSVPVFWQGTMAILLTSVYLHWMPPLHWISPLKNPVGNFLLMLLPGVTLGTASAAVVVRMTRNSLLEVLRQDFVRTARSKGLAARRVLFRHALKNALIPVVTVMGLQMGYLLGGAVVVEEVFTLPGVGRLLLQGLTQRDYPVVQGVVVVVGILFMLINLVTDLGYGLLDPRIRFS